MVIVCYINFEAKWDERTKGVKFDLSPTNRKESQFKISSQEISACLDLGKKTNKNFRLKSFVNNNRREE